MKSRKVKDIGFYLNFYHTAALAKAAYINMYFTGFKVIDLFSKATYYERSIEDCRFNYKKRGRRVAKTYSGRFFCGYARNGDLYMNGMHSLALRVIYAWYVRTRRVTHIPLRYKHKTLWSFIPRETRKFNEMASVGQRLFLLYMRIFKKRIFNTLKSLKKRIK